MPSGAQFRTSSGAPAGDYFLGVREALTVQQSDLLYAGGRQNERIHSRTEHHVDIDGAPFAPYSTKHPYYFRPWDSASLGRGKKGLSLESRRKRVPEASRIQSTRRFLRRIGGVLGERSVLRHRGREIAEIHSRERDTIRFDSYAAFKAALGRAGVDLVGPHAPHMMQAIEVSATHDELRIGIYDPEKAAIATGHNTGARYLPQRRFFGASKTDLQEMLLDIYSGIKTRLKGRP